MTVSGSEPKAQMNCDPTGTWNLEKLHLELKYLGRKERDSARLRPNTGARRGLLASLKNKAMPQSKTHLDCLFFLTSSRAKMWTVP